MSGGDDDALPPFVPPPGEYDHLDDDEAPPPDPTPDATDTRALAERKKRKKWKEEVDREFWQMVLEQKIGRRILWDWLSALHTFEDRIATGHGFPDPYATGVMAGQKSAGMRLFHTWLRYAPDATLKMVLENNPEFAPQKPAPRSE